MSLSREGKIQNGENFWLHTIFFTIFIAIMDAI
jgi:hypothetical protein